MPMAFSGKKKSSKSKKEKNSEASSTFDSLNDEGGNQEDEYNEKSNAAIQQSGKKASKSKTEKNYASMAFDVLGDEEDIHNDDGEGEPLAVAFTGKKKPSKSKKEKNSKVSGTFDILTEERDIRENDYDEKQSVVTFVGEKKRSESKVEKGYASSTFDVLGEEEVIHNDDGEVESLAGAFTGKKKPSKFKKEKNLKGSSTFDTLTVERNNQEDDYDKIENAVTSTDEKKLPKSKVEKSNASSAFDVLGEEEDINIDNVEALPLATAFTGKKKPSKSKKEKNSKVFSTFDALTEGRDNHEDEYDEKESVVTSLGEKKLYKSRAETSYASSAFNALEKEEDIHIDDGEGESLAVPSTGKEKPSKYKEKKFQSSSVFDALSDERNNPEDEYREKANAGANAVSFPGKKKPTKFMAEEGSVFSAFNAFGEEEDSRVNNREAEPLTAAFLGKKKPSKANKGKTSNSLVTVDAFIGEEEGEVKSELHSELLNVALKLELDELKLNSPADFDESSTRQQQLKKKKKKGGRTAQEEEDLDKILAELGEGLQPSSCPVVHTTPEGDPVDNKLKEVDVDSSRQEGAQEELASKNKQQKKKKKKTGRTLQEEEDLEKILAELGDGAQPDPTTSAPSSYISKESLKFESLHAKSSFDGVADEKEGEAEEVESAAAKKKKKKKEKEKEKKAAAAAAATATVEVEVKEEKKDLTKGKAADKKLPKHVREMQEALARRKEAEEKKKREEEERLRKEEEERKRLEEMERLAEEAKKRKKEREKEKLLKKKQEGKILTAKQKEEQKRLEAMRRQFLSQNDNLSADTTRETKKRPIYQAKKVKTLQAKVGDVEKAAESQNEIVDVDTVQLDEYEVVEDITPQHTEAQDQPEDKLESESMIMEEEEEEEEDEWDAKSWDDVDVKLPGINPFSEEDKEDFSAPTVISSPAIIPESIAVPPKSLAKKIVIPQESSKKEVEVNGPKISDSIAKMKNNADAKQEINHAEDPTKKNGSDLRSPICCILGHVDTGKTKLLDYIRCTNVQEGEAGGITQQIGATYFPTENIRERTKELKADATLRVPGLLIIDTPGHESFTNLRSRGSSLCDIAILVVDIMHGLEQQTIESLNLLKSRNTEFIVALNKVDRLYGWKKCPSAPIRMAMNQQSNDVKYEFNKRLTEIITQLKMQGLNTALYYKNRDLGETFNIVPTSAVSGEGIPDLLLLLVQWAQKTMEDKLTYVDEVQCTVLEVKVIEGLGTTVDVVLVNGTLFEGDQIVVCGMQGPIVTSIRALMTPHPMKELRVKGSYIHHKQLKAAQGVKISAQGLEHAIAGTSLYAVRQGDDIETIKEAVMQDMNKVMSRIDKSGEGVYVQASTLGSLEALTEFLKSPAVNIPFCDFSIGPVHKKDVMKASVMLERKKEYATILAFDVKVMPEARELAEESGVRIFVADIIYHLFDQFKAYIDKLKEEKKKESAEDAVFPCVLKIMPNCVFNKKDPIVLGVNVLEGIAKIGTPICVPSKDFIDIGRIASIEINHKQVDVATKDQKVAIKIVSNSAEEQQKMFGRHFEIEDELVSHISRRSIDVLKENYRDDLSNDEWRLVVKLKNVFKIL